MTIRNSVAENKKKWISHKDFILAVGSGKRSNNKFIDPFFPPNESSLFGLDMLYWGITLMVMGALICVLVLIFYAKNADRDFEKSQRRAARLAKDNVSSTTVDAEVQEAK